MLAPLLTTLLLPAFPGDAGDLSWNQRAGDAAGSSAVDVEPARTLPAERWRVAVGEVLGEPVVWGEFLYLAVLEGRTRWLQVHRLEDGELVVRERLGSEEAFTHLGVWQGSVAVVEPGAVRTFTHREQDLRQTRRERGSFDGAPCVVDGHLLVGGKRLVCVELTRGRVVAEVEGALSGRPAFHQGTVAGVRLQRHEGLQGRYLTLSTWPLDALATEEPRFGELETFASGIVLEGRDPSEALTLGFTGPAGTSLWYGRSPLPMRSLEGQALPATIFSTGALSLIDSRPLVHGGDLFGFTAEGELVRMQPDGRQQVVVSAGGLPAGARPGTPSRAGDVAYLGNWAIDLPGRRVLWCLPELEPAGPLLPVGDGELLAWTAAGEVVLLASGVAGPSPVAAPAPTRPGSGEAVVTEDGVRHPGTPRRGEDGQVLPPAGTRPGLRVAAVEGEQGFELLGSEHAVLLAWRDALDLETALALVPSFEAYRELRLLDEARRLLTELRERGLPGPRVAELEAGLAGRTENTASNAERQRARLAEEEARVRAARAREVVDAAAWCSERGLGGAATVLLGDALALAPGFELPEGRLEELVPASFPWHGPDAPRRWLVWARALLPSGARFVPADDPLRARVAGTLWERDTLVLCTPHLLLFSRCHEPQVVGPCLRGGETSLRALEGWFGRAPGEPVLLEARLHADRAAYLAEETPSGAYAMPWSAGYYSPAERVSRFYVPDPDDERSGQPLARSLDRVFAHELTHQFLAEAWLGGEEVAGGRSDQPGFWVVEGIARFIEDQVVDSTRPRLGFDDPTVPSVDTAAAIARRGGLMPVSLLVDLSQADFARLRDDPVGTVQLRHTLKRLVLTRRSIFYEQSAALVFFLLNHRGEEGRAGLEAFLREHYLRRSRPRGWEVLGYERAEDLQREFESFLTGLR